MGRGTQLADFDVPVRGPRARGSWVAATGGYRRLSGGRAEPFESLLERDAMVVVDTDPSVAAWRAQPETFAWVGPDLRRRRYTPDLLVARCDGTATYVEVKPAGRVAADPELAGRLPAIRAECAKRGADHAIWTENEVRRQPRLANALRIRAAIGFRDPATEARLMAKVRSLGRAACLGPLCRFAGSPAPVLALVAARRLAIDIEAPMSAGSAVWEGLT